MTQPTGGRRRRDPRRINPLAEPLLDYVVLDTETTGLSAAKGCHITEIGAVKVFRGRVTDSFSQLIDPGCHISGRITQITGIDDDMVAGKPGEAEAMLAFEQWLEPGTVVIAHNASFDFSFLDMAMLTALGHGRFEHRFLDTLEMSRAIHPEKRHHRVADLIIDYGIASNEAHRALSDAEQEQQIYVKLCAEVFDMHYTETSTASTI